MMPVAPILRTKEQARRYYDRISPLYDWLTASEKPLIEKAVTALAPQTGETILEVGSGTGTGLTLIGQKVRASGTCIGLDLAHKMLLESQDKAVAGLVQGDAACLPLASSLFDGVFCSFTLELFSVQQIPHVLKEIRRVLKPEGRLIVLGLSNQRENLALKVYELAHKLFPVAVDCRPIPIEKILSENNFSIRQTAALMNWGLPIRLVEGRPTDPQ